MRLFLFDIDGTLIDAHGAGRRCMLAAMEAVFGTRGAHDGYDWRGKTDPQIVSDLVRRAGVPEEVIRKDLPRCFEVYVPLLEAMLAGGHPVRIMPGIARLVTELSQAQDALVGLLTGNVEGGARAKLKPTGLSSFFRLGAYGSDDADRRRLPLIARQRACDLMERPIPFSDILIVGDTPLDVDCARACGARAVAVATGQHTLEELAACAPDLLFADFSDVDAVRRLLTRG